MPYVYVDEGGYRKPIEVGADRYRELTGMGASGGVMDGYSRMMMGQLSTGPSTASVGPDMVWDAIKGVGSHLGESILGPPSRVGEAIMTGKDVSLEDVTGANMLGMGAGWKGGLPAGATGVGMTFKESYPTFQIYKQVMEDMKIPLDLLGKQKAKGFFKDVPANEAEYMARAGKEDWSSIKSAIESIPRHKPGGLDLLTDLRAKFPDMPKGEFDEMMLGLSREGKISLHSHDMPGSYKGEMIKDGKTFYHAFGVKPDWR
jgi:hypothetical protein